MPRRITPETTLDGLKKEAKRWLRALREEGSAARTALIRLQESYPHAPTPPTLRTVQHALAREFGLQGWTELKALLSAQSSARPPEAKSLVDRFLEHACPDHHVRGGPAHVGAAAAAMRELADHPELQRQSFYTMVVCGDVDGVASALAADPSLATRKRGVGGPERGGVGGDSDRFRTLGPKTWEPILFLAFTRLPHPSVTEHAVAIARLLLEHGADPNVWFPAGGSRYTPLTGVAGEGEEGRPPHPARDDLVRLLLSHGANPYDDQVLYNIHFEGRLLWFLQMIYEETTRRGWASDWHDPLWPKLGMGGYGPGSYYVLKTAIEHDDLQLAEWALTHGASPNLPTDPTAYHPKFRPTASLYELAVRSGRTSIAADLLRHGATPSEVRLSPEESFTIAVNALDRPRAAALAAQHPEVLKSTTALFEAAQRDRVDIVELLLQLGVSPNVESAEHQRALHEAAFANSLKVAQLLIDHGAEIDVVGQWGGSPLGAASHSSRKEMLDLLAPHSQDIWELNFAGYVDRVRELLRQSPNVARIVTANKHTLLMWLPYEDETKAIEAARLLMSHGADPSIVNAEGQTAASRAEALGMDRLAAVLRGEDPQGSTNTPVAHGPLRQGDYDDRVQALLDAYRLGTPEALERHYAFTWHRRAWSGLRTYVQLDLGRHADDPDRERDITVDDARWLIAREHGFADWPALVAFVASPVASEALAKSVELLKTPKPKRSERIVTRDWREVLGQLRSGAAIGLDAHSGATDTMLADLRDLTDVQVLRLGGSTEVTDDGLRYLTSATALRELDLSGTSITDAGLDVLRNFPALEMLSLSNTRVSDEGVAALANCHNLQAVDLMWTATGDGALAALRGKPQLRRVNSGNRVSDAGLRHLQNFPVFKRWQPADETTTLLSYEDGPNHLMLRGPFTDAGLASLVGLDGLFGLNIDDARLSITPAGLAPLRALPHLGRFAVDAVDESMRYLAEFPALRFLGIQDTQATDAGWVHLGRSPSIQAIWGRRCHGLGAAGFAALAKIPTLRNLSVSCLNVPDDAVALLPSFPALRELMPMDVPDEGYRHIAKCSELDRLTLMYCRDTGDRATEHIVALRKLRSYFVSYNKITDRSLELLSTMDSLEEIELSSLADITDAGVAQLARLPRLKRLSVSGRNVTRPMAGLFPPRVEVLYDL
ncbi:MAG: ankyrin repeat domain-containing protein [Gemmatimonadaceae bacterium]